MGIFLNKTEEVVELYKLDADKKYQNFLEKVKNFTCECNNSTTSLIVKKIEAENKIPTVTTLFTVLPIAMCDSSTVYDGKDSIYILGGHSSSGEMDDILQFKISSEDIKSVAKLPVKVSHGTAIWDGEGVVHFGGWNGAVGNSNKIIRYIPGIKEAVEVGQLPFANRASATISHKPGEALIFGGFPGNKKIVHYKSNGSVANELSDRLPKDVYIAPAVYYSTAETESVFLFGGNSCNKDIIIYNVKTGQSVILNETLPFGLKGSNAFFVGKYIYVFGGRSEEPGCKDDTLSDNVVRFNPENNYMETLVLNGFPSSLRFFSAVYIKNLKRAYFFGGFDDSNNYRNQILKLQF